MIGYLDTSAALRVLTASPDSALADLPARTRAYLDDIAAQGDHILASAMLEVELRCQANRQPNLEPAEIQELLTRVDLVELEPQDLRDAPMTPGRLRTVDAIHLTVAIKLGAGLMIAFDRELRRAASSAGLRVGPEFE